MRAVNNRTLALATAENGYLSAYHALAAGPGMHAHGRDPRVCVGQSGWRPW
jgi:hypothetical protein